MKKQLRDEPITKAYEEKLLQKDYYEINEKVDAILNYLSTMMDVELVRNVKDNRLRFAEKDREKKYE